MSSQYAIVEPHPSVSTTQSKISTGRGGAGNNVAALNVTRGSDAVGPAHKASVASMTTSRTNYITGRGGAGNHQSEAPRMFSFDEELERQARRTSYVAPVYHVGRGGAGNLHAASERSAQRRESNISAISSSSAESGADIATRNLKRGLKRFTGLF